MMEMVEAYDQLMKDNFGSKVQDSRVALACEVYTIEELKMDRSYNVYPIQIIYDDDNNQFIEWINNMMCICMSASQFKS